MRAKHVMWLGLILSAGTLISLTFGGSWLGDDDIAVTNSLAVFKDANILGVWAISVPNIDFFFTGMKSLMTMDFAFFTGSLEIVQWFFLMVISVGVMWGIYTVIISVVQSALGRR